MPISRQKKEQVVAKVSKSAKENPVLFFIDFTGLKTPVVNQFRAKLREFGGSYGAVKKNLAKIAFKESVKSIPEDLLEKPGALGVVSASSHEIEIAKTIQQMSKSNETMKILGGVLEHNFLSAAEVVQLAKIPSREVLLGQLVGVLASPMRNLLWTLNANTQKLVLTLSAIQRSKQ